MLITRTHSSKNSCKIFVSRTPENTHYTTVNTLCRTMWNKLKFDLDRKLKSWLKFEPNFLTRLPKSKIEKTTVHLLFFSFIQFSAIEIRFSLFSSKACDKFIRMTEKKVGCPCSLVSYSHISTDSLKSRQICHVFSMHIHGGVLNDAINYAQKQCTMQTWGITLIIQ